MIRDTATLLATVLAGTLVLGTSLAWLVTAYQFPGRRLLGWLLVTPLAIPGYVLGFVWLDTLQEPLGARQVRSIWLAALVLTLTLYPYVYLFARAAFREQSQARRRRGPQPRLLAGRGVLAGRAADGAALTRRRRGAGGDGGAHRCRHRPAVQRVDDRRRCVAGVVQHRQPQRGRRARSPADRCCHRADRRRAADAAAGPATPRAARRSACTPADSAAHEPWRRRRSDGACSRSRWPCR